MLLEPQRQESPYTSRRNLLAAKGCSLDLSPSPEVASHPFKRKDKGIKGNPWREAVVLNLESSYSSCCLSHRAQFGVVVLQVFLESSCSRVFGVVMLLCELYSRFTHFYLGSVDTRSKQVDTSPGFQKTQLPDWDSRSTLDQSRRSLLAAKGGSPDLSPSPEAASHPFKRKDKGIKGNP
ncbi:hypothetical protein Taro_032055 [Colocasia esculenta]|uniref:Uncharacterized protein n=1 Tax=Colocasia esculenta TaxID=4460 RepID=A0A843W4Z8_COLES|nr:hypothetical protein [Colocasia esculenta]